MVAVTYADLHKLLNKTVNDITAANAEALIDVAIDTINLVANQEIANIAAGTVTMTGPQRGAVLQVAAGLYYNFYLGQIASNVGGVNVAPGDVMANPYMVRLLERVRFQLAPRGIVST